MEMKKLDIRYLIVCSLFLLLTLPFNVMAQDGAGDAEDPYAPVTGIPEGYKLIEEDILVRINEPEGTFDNNQWSNKRVPYTFHSNVNQTNRNRAIAAMNEIEAISDTAVDFRPRNGESNYVRFVSHATSNNSQVGMKGGRQDINIVSWSSKFIIVHECLHALGFWHEQSRPDRDSFVTIHFSRVQDGKSHNFDKKSSADVYGQYDFDSVMHYGQCAFSKNSPCSSSTRTITVKSPNTSKQSAIGQRSKLSDLDKLTVTMLYPPSSWRFVNGSYSKAPPASGFSFFQLGTFFLPTKTISKGVSVVPTGGTLIIQPGTYNGNGTYNKKMTFKAPLGGVTLN
ncbi:MAG: hypothetical protein D8M57_00780 [Candidatus Scalindua sp. AMX11]|nr:MAG: hypothetical protein DWQ00_18200 [Candidatus Scalindua sp.]RZV98855.1 MAG: hypothetical protein EX341_00120 [Candidatus Scalindua sp. SCAELEC01]TDE66953.1 MAG: hypothetical protein D8M57_00780 [Candidatus Scalindua sp. AMX11]